MLGFVIHPAHAERRIPGLVPRMDAGIDRMFAFTPEEPTARPVVRTQGITQDLPLPDGLSARLELLARSAGTGTEIDFRRSMLSALFEARIEPSLRRAVMSRAVSYYRGTVAAGPGPQHFVIKADARGGNYHRRIPKPDGGYTYVYDPDKYSSRPDAHLDGAQTQEQHVERALRKLLFSRMDGCDPSELSDLVRKYSAALVAKVAKRIGAVVRDGRIVHKSTRTPRMLAFARGEEFVVKSAPVLGTGHANSMKLPPGARRLWHNRIVEKMPDESWKVVGHVAGLEPSKQPPLLQHHEISPEHLRSLIAKIRAVEAAHPELK